MKIYADYKDLTRPISSPQRIVLILNILLMNSTRMQRNASLPISKNTANRDVIIPRPNTGVGVCSAAHLVIATWPDWPPGIKQVAPFLLISSFYYKRCT